MMSTLEGIGGSGKADKGTDKLREWDSDKEGGGKKLIMVRPGFCETGLA